MHKTNPAAAYLLLAALTCMIALFGLAGCGSDDIESLAAKYTGGGGGGGGGPTGPPYNIGNDIQFSNLANFSANFLHSYRFTVPGPTYLLKLGNIIFNLPGGPTNMRMALYTDFLSAPDVLVAGSLLQPVSTGVNEFPVPVTPIPPGDYWIAYNSDKSVEYSADTVSQPFAYRSPVLVTDPWPNPYNQINQSTQLFINIYMVVAD